MGKYCYVCGIDEIDINEKLIKLESINKSFCNYHYQSLESEIEQKILLRETQEGIET